MIGLFLLTTEDAAILRIALERAHFVNAKNRQLAARLMRSLDQPVKTFSNALDGLVFGRHVRATVQRRR